MWVETLIVRQSMKDDSLSMSYNWKVEIMEWKQCLFLGNETERDKSQAT